MLPRFLSKISRFSSTVSSSSKAFSFSLPARSSSAGITVERLKDKALEELLTVEENRDILLRKRGSMLIRDLAIGSHFPMRVMAEIVDAALMPSEEVQRLAQEYVRLGA